MLQALIPLASITRLYKKEKGGRTGVIEIGIRYGVGGRQKMTYNYTYMVRGTVRATGCWNVVHIG